MAIIKQLFTKELRHVTDSFWPAPKEGERGSLDSLLVSSGFSGFLAPPKILQLGGLVTINPDLVENVSACRALVDWSPTRGAFPLYAQCSRDTLGSDRGKKYIVEG